MKNELPAHVLALFEQYDAAKKAHRAEQREAARSAKPMRDELNRLKKKLKSAHERRQHMVRKSSMFHDTPTDLAEQAARCIYCNEWIEVNVRIETLQQQIRDAEIALLLHTTT